MKAALELREEPEMSAQRSVLFVVECVVGCCTTRSPSPKWAFLLEDSPLVFARRSAFCKTAESSQKSLWPVDRPKYLFCKTSPNQWVTTGGNVLIWHPSATNRLLWFFLLRSLARQDSPGPRHCLYFSAAAFTLGFSLIYSRLTTWVVAYARRFLTDSLIEFGLRLHRSDQLFKACL